MSGMESLRWRRRLGVTGGVLVVWFGVTFVLTYFSRELSRPVWGIPFSFWVAAQGAPLVYLILVAVYAGWMRRIDESSEADASSEDRNA